MNIRDTRIDSSSKGCLRFSKQSRRNSGNSSKKSTPWCARLIYPGIGIESPPTNAALDILWWRQRNGRVEIIPYLFGKVPITELILLTSKASSRVKSGIMEEILLASIVLPLPGGSIISLLWTQCNIRMGIGGYTTIILPRRPVHTPSHHLLLL